MMIFSLVLLQFHSSSYPLLCPQLQLKDELYEMERKLLLHDPVKSGYILDLQSKVDALSKVLEEKAEEMHDMESFNENLLLKEHTSILELAKVHKELFNVCYSPPLKLFAFLKF